jgi:hypothetical protein
MSIKRALPYREFKRLNESLQNSNTACKKIETSFNDDSKIKGWSCRPWNYDNNQEDPLQKVAKDKLQDRPKNGFGRVLHPDINMMFLFSLGDSNNTEIGVTLSKDLPVEIFTFKKKGTINDLEKINQMIDKLAYKGFLTFEIFNQICTSQNTAELIMKKILEIYLQK